MRRFARYAVGLALVALMAGSVAEDATAATAPAAARVSSPGWRITQVLAGVTVGGLWAGGARDAWLAGDECADQATCGVSDTSNGTLVIRHWNGAAWRGVTPPRAYVNSPLDQGVLAVAATSGSNAWVLAGRGTGEVDYTDALHWAGRGWARPVRLDAAIQSAVAPSATQLWAFGEASPSAPGYFAHFNGRTWTHGPFGVNGTAAAARSASDVWVGGVAAHGLGIEHWDGHRWRATPLPNLGLPAGDLAFANVVGLADLGARDVWADISTLKNSTILLHWNSRVWSRVRFPYAGDAPASVVSDGHGGIWLVTWDGSGARSILWFAHYAGGRWTRVRVPGSHGEQPQVFNLAWIPGSRSLWAAGGVTFANDGEAILKYGV